MSAANQQQETRIVELLDAARIVVVREAGGALDHPALDAIEAVYPAADALAARLVAAETALQRIRENARDWHGPLISIAGYERALGVIATWCDEALASPDAAAKEPTDYLYPGCGCPLCRPRTT